jgi:segregation and condensation protein B
MTVSELKPIIETLIFVAEEPLGSNELFKILSDEDRATVETALAELISEFNSNGRGLEIRQLAGGYRISTRPEYHEYIRRYLKTRPSARLSLPSLETLAVIAYKQPITLPEIQEIRGVSSVSTIKTLLEKGLIEPKGRKQVVGRPIMYGTSREFLIQFGLNDLGELPTIEDFQELAG